MMGRTGTLVAVNCVPFTVGSRLLPPDDRLGLGS